MISIIFGIPGAGKTALMTSFAIERMTGELAKIDVENCLSEVCALNSGGFSLYLPKIKHLVYSDYFIGGRRPIFAPPFASMYCNGFYIGMPNEFVEVDFFPPFAQFYLDEAQRYFNSRRFTKSPDWLWRFYELHRQSGYNVTMTCQRPALIDINIREIAEEFIFVERMSHEYTDERISKTTWHCRCFSNYAEAEEYIKTHKGGEKVKYRFEGNIFSYYDHRGQRAAVFAGRYDANFLAFENVPLLPTRESYETFNEVYDYKAPQGFYGEKSKAKTTVKKEEAK